MTPALTRPVSWALLLVLVAVIGFLDVLTSAGVVVGLLLAIPVLLASTRPEPRDVYVMTALAIGTFAVAALVGRPPLTPPAFWVPNRILAVLSLPASGGVALLLQHRRMEAERARDAAVAARDLNGVLMSLLAHDLRAPLSVARQCIGYVEDGLAEGRTPDAGLLAETRARLDRSIRAIEIVLSVARAGMDGAAAGDGARRVRVAEEIHAEAESFAGEAALGGKRLELRLDGVTAAEPVLNPLVLRQALAILLDNAIRYAAPGAVTVSAALRDGRLRVAVADAGPAGDGGAARLPRGAGLGLELSRALLAHAGGALEQESTPEGPAWVLSLPVAANG